MAPDKANGLKETLIEVCEWFGLRVRLFDLNTAKGTNELVVTIRADSPTESNTKRSL